MPNLLYPAVLLLALALPFESIRPVLSLGSFQFTNLELLVGLTAIPWTAQLIRGTSARLTLRRGLALPPLSRPALLFLLLALLSAVIAPEYRFEALKFVLRLLAGFYVFLLASQVAGSPSRLVGVLWAITLGAGLSALIGLGEALGWSAFDQLIGTFKAAPTRVGGELRVSATFQYATIAAIYLEMAAPLAIVLAATARARSSRLIAAVLAALCSSVVVLTLTRASYLALLVVFGLLAIAAWTRPSWRTLLRPTAIAALSMLLISGVLVLNSGAFTTRILTENDRDWYGALYEAPQELSLPAGERLSTTVTVHNTGQAVWTATGAHAYALGYRWLSVDGQSLVVPGHSEVLLPWDVTPGETVSLSISLEPSLPPGTYSLSWGMLQQRINWFRHRDVPETATLVHVTPRFGSPPARALGPPISLDSDRGLVPIVVPRADLWRAALGLFLERPLLGVGPDNFRHLYGRKLGLPDWDSRLHANNLYLELLADFGLLGAVAFGWILVAAVRRALGTLRPGGDLEQLYALGLGGALLAFLVHGLLDYFLEFTPLYLLFWITLGLLVASTSPLPPGCDQPSEALPATRGGPAAR